MFTHLSNSYFDPFDYYPAFRRTSHSLFNPFYSNKMVYVEPFLMRKEYDNTLDYLLKQKIIKEQLNKMKEETNEKSERSEQNKQKQLSDKSNIFEELFETPFSNIFKQTKQDLKLSSPFEQLFNDKIFKNWFNPFDTQKLEQEVQQQKTEKDSKKQLNDCDEKPQIQSQTNNSNPKNQDNKELNESQVSEKQSLLKSMIEEEFNTMTLNISQPENTQSIIKLNENQKDERETNQKQLSKDLELFEKDKKILKEHDFTIEENDEDDDKKWIYGSKQQKYKDNGIQEEKFYKVENKKNHPKLSTQIYEKTIKNKDDNGNYEKQFIQLTTHKY